MRRGAWLGEPKNVKAWTIIPALQLGVHPKDQSEQDALLNTPLRMAVIQSSIALAFITACPLRLHPSAAYSYMISRRVLQGHTALVEHLIQGGADCCRRDMFEYTVLHWAAIKGRSDIVAKLINAGTDVHARSKNGLTAVALAYDDTTREMLLKAGASNFLADDDVAKELLKEMEAWRKDPAAAAGALQQASADGDTATLTRMLQMGVGADSPNQSAGEGPPQWERAECDLFDFTREHQRSPVEEAIVNGHTAAVDILVGCGASIYPAQYVRDGRSLGQHCPDQIRSKLCKTALHLAVANGSSEILHTLIQAGAAVNEGDMRHRTPLHLAAALGNTEAATTLIQVGALVNALDMYGHSPLHLASENGHVAVVDALIGGGALVAVENEATGEYGLKNATGLRGPAVLMATRAKTVFWNARTPLPSATDRGEYPGHATLLDIFLSSSPAFKQNLQKLAQRHNTPLHLAASNGHTTVVEALVKGGAFINAKDADEEVEAPGLLGGSHHIFWKRNTSLHLAALNGHLETVQALIAAGADIHAKNSREESPLHLAACGGAVPVLEALITAGALAHVVDKEGCTPLHLAAYKGRTKAAEALLTLGADLQAQGQVQSGLRRFQPWQEIAVVPPGAVVEYMDPDAWMRGADKKPPPSGFVKGEVIAYDEANDTHILVTRERDGEKVDDTKEMKLTLKNVQFKLFAKDGVTAVLNGMTPLMLAACKGQTTTIDFLIKSGADIHLSTQHGYTPLHYAAKQGHTSAVAALITAGADIHAKDMQHRTALHVAVNNGHLATGEQLVAAGADDQAQDVDGETPAAALATQKAEEKNAPSKNTEASTVVMLKVSGAKLDVNGEYTQDGVHNGKPKYKSVEGHIIYFAGVWKMNDVDDTDAWYYTSMACGSLHFVHDDTLLHIENNWEPEAPMTPPPRSWNPRGQMSGVKSLPLSGPSLSISDTSHSPSDLTSGIVSLS
ncbi:hypothetical protein CYMTET_43203 [Cymbomonas tetramitiformis]|uniref:Uncharacterized protein n=1 Tax=Cymbomonas tetramitiformis TaxID=36881 RepID=A0AAE0C3W9_9CHLO|nr:hypothetical protein CYMTET_43203 [Cymbomonas tetramitiformis]